MEISYLKKSTKKTAFFHSCFSWYFLKILLTKNGNTKTIRVHVNFIIFSQELKKKSVFFHMTVLKCSKK